MWYVTGKLDWMALFPWTTADYLPALIFDVCGCAGMPEPDTPVDLTKSPSPGVLFLGRSLRRLWSPSNNMRGTALPSNESANLSSACCGRYFGGGDFGT
jgi:hypothetical protein